MTGEKCCTIKKCFSLKLRQKKRNKKVQNINNKKSRKIRERKKMRQNENKVKKVLKKFFKDIMKRKDIYNLSNLERRF